MRISKRQALENITWRVALSDKWRIKKWSGSLQLAQEEITAVPAAIDLQNYFQTEASAQRGRTKQPQDFMALANGALEKGDEAAGRIRGSEGRRDRLV